MKVLSGHHARCRLFLTAASIAACGGVAHAEGAAPEAQVQEIVVVAQRRAEALENVPIAMTVASGEQLEKSGMTRLDNIQQIAPGVQLARTGIVMQPAIRGVTSAIGSTVENNVGIYVDGIYIASPRGLNLDLVNISQIEILKGPQGTLFGRNATGGAILINTLDPSLSRTEGRFSASYGRFNDRKLMGYVSAPLSDSFAMNFTAAIHKSDGYIKDVDGFDTAHLRSYDLMTKLLYQPDDRLRITAKLETARNSDNRALAVTFEGRSLAKFLFPTTILETGDNKTSVNRPMRFDVYQHTAGGKIEYDFGPVKLSALTSYQLERTESGYDLDGTKFRFFEQYVRSRSKTFIEDINLTSQGDSKLQYTVGVFYFRNVDQNLPGASLSFPSTVYLPGQTNDATAKAYAGYADVTWEVVPRLFLTGGVRLSKEKKIVGVRSGLGVPTFNGQRTFNSTTPRAVVRYQVDDHSNVYASFSKGFKSGFINVGSPFNFVEPEKITAYEIGYKTARRIVRLDTAAYYYDYKNLQVASTQIQNGQNLPIVNNAAVARIYGAEAQVTYRPAPDFNVRAGLAYTHARYKRFTNAAFNPPNPITGLNASSCPNPAPPPATIPCTQDWSGKRIARAPDWSATLAADYTIHSGLGDVLLAGNVAYSSRYAPSKGDLFADGTFRYEQGAFTLVNVRAAWTPAAHDRLTLSVYGNNIFDARYYIYRTGNAFGDYHVLGTPASWGVQADYQF